jgi:hypothetical protein
MNASDIIKAKQNGTLYKAYYTPTVLASTTYTNYYPVSSLSTNSGTFVSSFTSSISTVYTYTCNNPVISYNLVNDVNNGAYICGGKKPSVLTWKANQTTPTEPIYAFQTYSTSTSAASTILSLNNYAERPLICPDPIYTQGNKTNNSKICINNTCGIYMYSFGGK